MAAITDSLRLENYYDIGLVRVLSMPEPPPVASGDPKRQRLLLPEPLPHSVLAREPVGALERAAAWIRLLRLPVA